MKRLRYLIYEDLLKGRITFEEADLELTEIFQRSIDNKKDKFKSILNEVKREWKFGSKQLAIKMLKEASGMRLKRCKEYCESHF